MGSTETRRRSTSASITAGQIAPCAMNCIPTPHAST